VTRLLGELRAGDEGAAERLLPLVYGELRSLADAVFNGQSKGHTLQPTALVHEAWLKLDGNLGGLEGRRHFFAVAAKAMRQVLADHARSRGRAKRGGGQHLVTLDEAVTPAAKSSAATPSVDLIALHDALEKLTQLNERHARVVELRLLGSMTIAETAQTLGVSDGTVKTDWTIARAWLWRALGGE
jgi:RNA polymerase sigma factor (TIGR02999 family)